MLGRQRRRKHYQWFSLLFFRGTKKKNLIKFVNMNRFFPLVTTWVSMTADPMSGSSWSSNFLQYHPHLGANNNLNLHTLILSKNVCFKLQLCTRLHRVEFEIKSINQTLYFCKVSHNPDPTFFISLYSPWSTIKLNTFTLSFSYKSQQELCYINKKRFIYFLFTHGFQMTWCHRWFIDVLQHYNTETL